jgi:Putative prokaryotic signal transducing protein
MLSKRWSVKAEMVELLRTNDMVYLSFVRHMLNEEGIDHLLLDEHMSAVEGSINAIPRRIVVAENMLKCAQKLLSNHSLTINQ